MKHLLRIGCLIVSMYPAFGQKDFKSTYDVFRFKLHDLVNSDNPMRVSNSMAQHINSFLDDHAGEILKYRKAQLKQYERDEIADFTAYAPVSAEDLETVKAAALWIASKERLVKTLEKENIPESLNTFNNFRALQKLLCVSPVEMISVVSGQVISQLFYTHFTREETASAYAKLGVCGIYISTKRTENANWIVTVNSYYIISIFSVDANTGEINLTEVLTRKA